MSPVLCFMTWMFNREVNDEKREQMPIAYLQTRLL